MRVYQVSHVQSFAVDKPAESRRYYNTYIHILNNVIFPYAAIVTPTFSRFFEFKPRTVRCIETFNSRARGGGNKKISISQEKNIVQRVIYAVMRTRRRTKPVHTARRRWFVFSVAKTLEQIRLRRNRSWKYLYII